MSEVIKQGSRRSLLARLLESGSRFASRHGIYLGRRSTRIHVALYRRTNGRIGAGVPGEPGARILLLDHIGAKTGIRRTSPLVYYADGDRLAIVASKAGQPNHPGWYHNLKANPDTTIRIGGDTHPVRARVATEEERITLWPEFVAIFPAYDFYRHHAANRTIPIVILEPTEQTADRG